LQFCRQGVDIESFDLVGQVADGFGGLLNSPVPDDEVVVGLDQST